MWTADSRQPSRRVAYVTMHDASARADIVATLERAGWVVIPQPTGFHLLQAIADVVEAKYTWLDPMLIVIDAYARGCAGTTIAAGLRELGIEIPIVLVTRPGQPVPVATDEALRIVDSSSAADVVAELARPRFGTARDSPVHRACLKDTSSTSAASPRSASGCSRPPS
jgi:hypothetical protein